MQTVSSYISERFARFTRYELGDGVSIAPLVTMRVAIGMLIAYGALRFLAEGWVARLLVEPSHYFSYYGFAWIPRPGAAGAYGLYFLLVALGAAVALGYRYRFTAPALFLAFLYSQLLDATNYLNHYYLLVWLSGLLCLLPAHRAYSLDVVAGRAVALAKVPFWMIAAFMVQLALVYGFAGVAKINGDWLQRAMPLAIWLPEHADLLVLGPVLAKAETAYLGSWAAMLYDCTIVGWLLWQRSRKWAYLAVLGFHALTGLLFNIGLFPLIMVALTTVYFAPSTHARVWHWVESRIMRWRHKSQSTVAISGESLASAGGMLPVHAVRSRLIVGCLVIGLAAQLVLPVRAAFYDGQVAWHEQGYRFGWRVMLVEKVGNAEFSVHDGRGRRERVDLDALLTPYQQKQMSIQPDLILQTAHLIAKRYGDRGWEGPRVQADVRVALNGRRTRRLIEPDYDLSQARDTWAPKSWILPL